MAKKRGKVVNLAIVGCGGMAGAHLRGYEELIDQGEGRFRIVAAVDEVEERAQSFAERIGGHTGWEVKTYKSVEQLLNSGVQVDGADICSPLEPAAPGPALSLRHHRGSDAGVGEFY